MAERRPGRILGPCQMELAAAPEDPGAEGKPERSHPMSLFASVVRIGPSVVTSLLVDRRLQVALALAVGLIATALLGSGEAAAGWSTSPG